MSYQTSGSQDHAAAITPSDTVDLSAPCNAIYVGGAGALTVITVGGETVAFPAVPAGAIIPIRATRIKATGTVATNLVAMW